MTAIPFPRRGLYLITPDHDDSAQLLAQVEAVLPFAACLQYRNKRADAKRRHDEAMALRAMTRQQGVCFIVNDDADLARQVEADGVHLGEGDGALTDARRLLGAACHIGISCYDDLPRAEAAVAAGADYVAFGALFASATKPAARRASPALLTAAAKLGVPRVAIGGITPDNAHLAVAAGADLLAVIGGVFAAADPREAARACAAAFD